MKTVKLIALINTTIRPFDMTAAEARQKRQAQEPEDAWRSTITKGKTYEVPEEFVPDWVKYGIGKPVDPEQQQPDPEVVKAAERANNGQAASNPEMNLQHPELAVEGQKAVETRIASLRLKRLAEEAAQAKAEQPAIEQPAIEQPAAA